MEQRRARLGVLLGTELSAIYAPPENLQTSPKYLQVFPDGHAVAELNDGSLRTGLWHTDGSTIHISGETATYSVPVADLKPVEGVPAGARFEVRLLDELSSRQTHEGDTVRAVALSPVVVEGKILIPSKSIFDGKVIQADSVGWGFKHETASLTVDWRTVTLPDRRVLDLNARVYEVENAQEKVDKNGKIKGIRSTGTIGNSVENGVLSFAGVDPVAYVFAMSAGSGVFWGLRSRRFSIAPERS